MIALQFPVYLPIGPWQIHPHWLFETLAYAIGFRFYLWLRKRMPFDPVPEINRLWAVAGAAAGGAIGAKLLYWFEDPAQTLLHLHDLPYLIAGKSIVGGLLGGLIGVELTKRLIGERASTGDLFTLPLMLGMAIGRIGCFLTGLPDNTHGVATSLPWGVDFGDGIFRHPTQLYEIAFLALWALWILWRRRLPHRNGDLFRAFMIGYLAFRLLIDALKPYPHPYLGLTATQFASLIGLLYYGRDMGRVLFMKGVVRHG